MTNTTQQNQVAVSVVLPAYNEVDYLTPAVEKTINTLNTFTNSYEIIIAEDGSTDGTAERSEELTQKYPCVRHIHREARLGQRNRTQQRLHAKATAKCSSTWTLT